MAENKTRATASSVRVYIETIADPTRRSDAKMLVRLMQRASGEKPTMWGSSIIGFGSYHYRYDSGREGDMPVISFSPRKAATSSLPRLRGAAKRETCKQIQRFPS